MGVLSRLLGVVAAALVVATGAGRAMAAPPQGACCLTNATCVFVKETVCARRSGAWRGPGVSCTPTPCGLPRGACCAADGGCMQLTRPGCKSRGGTFQGAQTSCAPSPCPRPVPVVDRSPSGPSVMTGACCLDSGACVVLAAADCAQAQGTYTGDGRLCSNFICVPATGACCLTDLTCIVTAEADCRERTGLYRGPRTLCTTTYCPALFQGSCCRDDGSCVVTTFGRCWPTGQFTAEGVCAGRVCTVNAYACCMAGDTCVVMDRTSCLTLGGRLANRGTCRPRSCRVVSGCDWDASGTVDLSDLFAYLADYRDGIGDVNGDGAVDERDAREFVGCLLQNIRFP